MNRRPNDKRLNPRMSDDEYKRKLAAFFSPGSGGASGKSAGSGARRPAADEHGRAQGGERV